MLVGRFFLFVLVFPSVLFAQGQKELLCQNAWEYAHTFVVEESAIIHSTEMQGVRLDFHDYGVVEIQKSGAFTGRTWKIEADKTLLLRYQDHQQFEIVQLTEDALVLQFSQSTPIAGTFQYHFHPLKAEIPATEIIPTEKARPSLVLVRPPSGARIQIELSGGGYEDRQNPILKNQLLIRNDGQVFYEYQKVRGEKTFSQKSISRAELEELANYLFDQGFFELEEAYTCQNEACRNRLIEDPVPLPLRVAFRYGNYRKVVELPIFSTDAGYRKVLDYPAPLDRMIQAIRRIAE